MKPLQIAILDMYDNFPNEGMRCIRQLVHQAQQASPVPLTYQVFNVRANGELPGLDYDIYISSGGPGSPLPSTEPWEQPYFALMDALLAWNRTQERKKYVFLICHSFQLVSRHLGIGTLSKRKSTSFGIFPMHMTDAGQTDPLLRTLPDPFYAVDSRDYQLTQPNAERLAELGVEVLVLEKDRPHVPLERALMALRFTEEIFGTQFHPEADREGMLRHFRTEEKRQQVIEAHGEAKYHDMVRLLEDPEAIARTEAAILPRFLAQAVAALAPAVAPLAPTR
ncbi:homoserine O-succinyltransferase [Hymenobacter sp. HSC-4F20]|uniref:type 1 glutamine amidotransferase n=1 Tax=Hymenobacter sp. HSC-4F20 TaxID=2864135 RepID=UPI001C72B362|nr:homoserine O-succinyltransferase [Hymenobacter sp. HSC-4F20]MBX0289366.1 homoserine O-succinyltransferase [Hymenobacter sp. HSC-4F20]